MQRARNTGTNNYPAAPNASNNVTTEHSMSVLIGDLSSWPHLTACSPCQEVDTTTILRPLIFDQRRAGYPILSAPSGSPRSGVLQPERNLQSLLALGQQLPRLECSDDGVGASLDNHIGSITAMHSIDVLLIIPECFQTQKMIA